MARQVALDLQDTVFFALDRRLVWEAFVLATGTVFAVAIMVLETR